MKKINNIVAISVPILLLGIIVGTKGSSLEKESKHLTQFYKHEVLFEKSFSTQEIDSGLNMGINENNFGNYFILTDEWNSPMVDFPTIAGIDKQGYIYIFNIHKSVKVFDNIGKFLYKFSFPSDYFGTFPSIDNQNNLYLFMRQRNDGLSEELVYKINVREGISRALSSDEIKRLDPILLPTKSVTENISKLKFTQGKNGIYYDVRWGQPEIKSIFQQDNGRFISPSKLIVYLFDDSFDTIYIYEGIPDKYKFDMIDISNTSNEKIIYINSYKVDTFGNIYTSGIKSDKIEKTIINKGTEMEKVAVKVLNPIFFVWRFDKSD